jgi:hypothetical protein
MTSAPGETSCVQYNTPNLQFLRHDYRRGFGSGHRCRCSLSALLSYVQTRCANSWLSLLLQRIVWKTFYMAYQEASI